MDKKDVANISVAVAFNKKWWDNHRASKIKGTGTGAMLDQWRKSNLAGALSTDGLEKAYKDCDDLKKSLLAAKKLCGPKEADDEKGIDKMLDLLADHRTLLDKRQKTLDEIADTITTAVEKIDKFKPELARCAKEYAMLETRYRNAEAASNMDISEEDKKQLLKNVGVLKDTMEKLRLDVVVQTNGAKSIAVDKTVLEAIKYAKSDNKFKPILTKFNLTYEGFEEIGSRLHEDIQMLQTDTIELEKDIAGTATTKEALQLLETQLIMLNDAPMFQGWVDLLDKARVWVPRIINARKNPSKVSDKEWDDFNNLVPAIEDGVKQTEIAAAQVARILKMTSKNAARFPDAGDVKDLVSQINVAAKKRLAERVQAQKAVPPFLSGLKQLVEARPS